MSKAFTKEDDDAPVPPVTRLGIPVPDPNPVTAAGLAQLRADPDAPKEHLATAVVVGPPEDRNIVAFGATITVEDATNTRHVYRIVGAVESDPKHGAISWQSPIARALVGARVGDSVALPRGDVEIVAIEY